MSYVAICRPSASSALLSSCSKLICTYRVFVTLKRHTHPLTAATVAVPVVALTSNLWVWAAPPVVVALVDLVEVDLVANSKDMEDITVVVDLMDRAVVVDMEAVALVDPVGLMAVEALMDQDPAVVVDDGKREWFIMG